MTIDLNTNLLRLFSGTYGTDWEAEEYGDNGEELEIDYTMKDLMQSIVEAYQSQEIDIVQLINIPWVQAIKFTGDFASPREYNFSTDTLDFTLEVDEAGMIKVLEALENDKVFAEYLVDNFRSRDGFWSYTPDNYPELRDTIKQGGDQYHQAIGALLGYLISEDTLGEIETEVMDHWRANGYMGLNYTVVGELD